MSSRTFKNHIIRGSVASILSPIKNSYWPEGISKRRKYLCNLLDQVYWKSRLSIQPFSLIIDQKDIELILKLAVQDRKNKLVKLKSINFIGDTKLNREIKKIQVLLKNIGFYSLKIKKKQNKKN